MSIITYPGYHIRCLKFGQRKNTGKPVFLWLVLPPADIIVYIILSDLLLFMDFIKIKTIKKY